MCGVIGALAYGEFDSKKDERDRQESIIFLVSELLQLTQSRGKDATGIATLFANCDYMGLKMGISAQEFVARFGDTEKDYEGYLNIWRKKKSPAKIVIGHCRKPSTGTTASVEDNKNNHPIKVGDIVGVHNGTLNNHETIFTNLKCGRDGNVDSEAIFRLLSHYTNNGEEPFTVDGILETCKRVDGSYSCLAFSGNNPYQLAAFRDGRPLEVCIIRPLKLVLIASEKEFLKAVIFRYNKMANLYHGGIDRFTPLKKSDIDIEMLADDSLFLFDVHDEITNTTQIKDLYVTAKIPRTEKIWKKTVATYGKSWQHNNNNNTTEAKKTEVDTTKPKTTTSTQKGASSCSKDGKRLGMAWNRTNAQYESVCDVDETSEHGNVEIDVESGEIIDVSANVVLESAEKKTETSNSSKETPKFPLEESNTPVDDLINDPSKINEIAVGEIKKGVNEKEAERWKTWQKAADEVAERNKQLEEATGQKNQTVIDVSTYPDVVEKVQNAVCFEPNFSNDKELADAIEISNKEIMHSMALYSLANRIKSYFFKRGYYAGYVARLQEEEGRCTSGDVARNLLIRAREKAASSRQTIRVMKTMVKIYDSVVSNSDGTSVENKVNRAVTEAFEKGEDVKSSVIKKVFRDGDIQQSTFLKRIISLVSDKEER